MCARENRSNEHVSSKVFVGNHFTTAKIFDSESEEPILLVGLEHGCVGVRSKERFATARVDEVAPVVLRSKSEIFRS